MTVWRKVASLLVTLGGALIGLLLAARREPSQRQREEDAADDQRVADINASMPAYQHAVMTEEQKQRDLAKQAAGVDGALVQVDARVEGLSHDNLDAEIHHALAGAPGPGAPPAVVKPGGVIKPAS